MRKWITMLLGTYLFLIPWIIGTSGDKASSANAWIVGACIVVVTLRMPVVSGPRAAELSKSGLGAWLLASPFALSFAGTGAGWSACIVGVLIFALTDTLSLTCDCLSWIHAQKLRYQARRISPEKLLLRYREREEHMHPERLCRHIVECSYEIRQALLKRTFGVEVGMCVLGYRACVNDRITLNRLIDKQLPESTLLRRLRLKIARRQATRALSLAREVVPSSAPHAWHRSRP